MTEPNDEITTSRKTVVFFDICSSTAILEDLLRTENIRTWRNVLIGLKKWLLEQQGNIEFEIYKFLGDGWILLFDDEKVTPGKLIELLKGLCREYESLYQKKVFRILGVKIPNVGLTFGIDEGTLLKIVMNQHAEYIGRPLNVAARLQGSIKQKDSSPEGKLLISKNAYVRLGIDKLGGYTGKLVSRKLSNIAGGENYQVRKIVLHER
jgi:class 3 adenylate cyclase